MGAIELYWLPLGAGGHSVKFNGRVYEAIKARQENRPRFDLYHAALQVVLPGERYVIEQAPVQDIGDGERGVVAEGPVGARWLGRFRIFRYEIRLWRGGQIPDLGEAVDSPRRVSADEREGRRLLSVVPRVPRATWGRDEFGAGEMWNSNSIVAWILSASGINAASIHPPPRGRAPGWNAGVSVAQRNGMGGGFT